VSARRRLLQRACERFNSRPGTTRLLPYAADLNFRSGAGQLAEVSTSSSMEAKRSTRRCVRMSLRLRPAPHSTAWITSPSMPLS